LSDETIIDLKDGARDLKAKLQERWQTEHTHFMDLMRAIIPAANMVGEPMVSVGWKHVVERVMLWRRMLRQQSTALDMVMQALDRGEKPEQVKALCRIQKASLEGQLAPWEPVPKIPAQPD
jgi:hypothetical protein